MQPLASLLIIDKAAKNSVYLQLAGQLTSLIKNGTLPAGHRLPGTRQLAALLQVHRKTVIRAYDDLLAQGWLESHLGNGTFVAHHLPEIKPQQFVQPGKEMLNPLKVAGFAIDERPHLKRENLTHAAELHLDDGYPDIRLAPLEELSRAYRTQLLMGNSYARLGYSTPKGSLWLRETLADYLNESRGLKATAENILITRGSVMGIYLASTALLQPGDKVVAGQPGWAGANSNFIQAGARLLTVRIDEYGIDTDELAYLCQLHTIRMVYVTSHHHHPTTVSLRADRRLHLLQLAAQFGFIIFEDDYDYHFHYENKPLLPLASADENGMVLYCGSFTKIISPAFRVGYLVGPENVIEHLAQLRRHVDRQGDTMLDNAIAELLQGGSIQRHLRKSLRLYRQRRDVLCELLSSQLSNYLDFNVPEGGLAVWTRFDEQIDITDIAKKALKQGLYIPNGLLYSPASGMPHAIRLGFASSTPYELEKCTEILVRLIKR